MVLLDLIKLNSKYKFNIDGIAHIGAHNGAEVPLYQQMFKQIPMYLFEPQNDIYLELLENVKPYSNIFCFNFGLGSNNETATFYKNTNNDHQSSSILKPKDHLKYHPHIKFEKTNDIDIKKLDSLDNIKVNFLNIDVQGYELEVLKGAVKTLTKIDYIYSEVNRKELYENCVIVNDLDKFLDFFGFIRCETKWWNNVGTWGDALYIKKNRLSFQKTIYLKIKNRTELIKGYFFIKKFVMTLK